MMPEYHISDTRPSQGHSVTISSFVVSTDNDDNVAHHVRSVPKLTFHIPNSDIGQRHVALWADVWSRNHRDCLRVGHVPTQGCECAWFHTVMDVWEVHPTGKIMALHMETCTATSSQLKH